MKLLIITQVLDRDDPILGFFHRWVAEFAMRADSVKVIALKVGQYDLPQNVQVHSLGKESGQSRAKYLWRFYRDIWQLRHSYDAVFIHMNQQYVILGYPVWRLFGTRIGLWYAHGAVTRSLRLAVNLADIVFTSTPHGLQIDTPKRVIVGQGIDYGHFAPAQLIRPVRTELQLLTVGRIAASKNIDTLLAACLSLKATSVPFHFSIIGTALTEADQAYQARLLQYCVEHNLVNEVTWVGAVSQMQLPDHLHRADVFIHDGGTQSLDKALLEAVAAGCVVVSSNLAYKTFTEALAPENIFPSRDAVALAGRLRALAPLSPPDYVTAMSSIRSLVQNEHSIEGLIVNIVERY